MIFLAGAVIGAGVALLLAPASGEETRRRLSHTAKRLRDEVHVGRLADAFGSFEGDELAARHRSLPPSW
jgi:hypothetical protein